MSSTTYQDSLEIAVGEVAKKRVLLEPHISTKAQHGDEVECNVCLSRELCASYQYKLA